jgi:hypothetical protein
VAGSWRGSLSLVGAVLVLMIAVTPVAARDQLLNGSVAPHSGNTSTLFRFAVTYQGTHSASGVTADLTPGGPAIALTPLGSTRNGEWIATRSLPAGDFSVTFRARTSNRTITLTLPYHVTVNGQPTPSPTPSPTAPATPTPTPTPIPPTPIAAESVTPSAIPSPSTSAPPQTPTAIGGAVSEGPSASGAVAGTVPSPVADLGPLALYLLAGVLAVGLLAGIAGLAAGSPWSASGGRTAPVSPIGSSVVGGPAEPWDEAQAEAPDEAPDQSPHEAPQEAADGPAGQAPQTPTSDDATVIRDTPWSLDPDDPRGL